MERSKHNPLSQESVGIREVSKEEKARNLGRSIEFYESTVLTLDTKDMETRQRLIRFLKHGKFYDYESNARAKEIVEELLGNGSFDCHSYISDLKSKDVYPYYSVQSASQAIQLVDRILRNDELADRDVEYDDLGKEAA